jgi:hypothetical protein
MTLPLPYAYWVVCPKAAAKLRKIAAFTDWLLPEAARDARHLQGRKRKMPSTVPIDLLVLVLATFAATGS